jgi:alkanesulfonate monooxygenase SsuD/methylene tetrahydromethanopterin reductase-like flavin-dependent oxidoreductase (luciferase family)
MRIGLALPHYDTSLRGEPASWEGVARVAKLAEDSGFDSIWMSDHLFLDWSKYGGSDDIQGSLECWTTLAGLAAVTSDIRLGSLTLCNDLRNPGVVAKMIATLDQLSGGRLDVGFGGGWYEPEYEASGIPFDGAGKRIRRLGESVALVARLLEGETVDHDGENYIMSGAVCRPGPLQEPRPFLWVGGKGDLLLETAAAVADGWNMSWLGSEATFDAYALRSAVADRQCEKIGRDPSSFRRSVGANVLVGSDESDARKRFDRLAERTPAGVLSTLSGEAGVSWETFKQERVAGTVEEVSDRLGGLSDLGVEEVIVSLGTLPFQLGDEDDVPLFGTEIGPRIR